MSDDLRELYQDLILDHNRNPKNYGRLQHANRTSHGHNPLCGDQVVVFLRVEDGVIREISFEGNGCAISKASASLMTTALQGKTVAEAQQLFRKFQQLITGELGAAAEADSLGKLAIFAGVREFPIRVKCAGLAWHTMAAALARENAEVTTE